MEDCREAIQRTPEISVEINSLVPMRIGPQIQACVRCCDLVPGRGQKTFRKTGVYGAARLARALIHGPSQEPGVVNIERDVMLQGNKMAAIDDSVRDIQTAADAGLGKDRRVNNHGGFANVASSFYHAGTGN